ncbi:MAG TPA: hypothetical protein VHC47_01890 [Mucilaginibacter sp.]|nr:hypothetical protein [Mucilaginibacter sp.]
MKRFKKILRISALILFMLLAAAGISMLGVAPALTKEGKLSTDTEMVQAENTEEESLNADDTMIKR